MVLLSDEMPDIKHLWLENLLDIEQIIELMESCDKDCANCSRTERIDCILELRESVHSMAKILKNAVLSMVNAGRNAPQPEPMITKPPEMFS